MSAVNANANTNVIAEKATVPKTLPMKYKSMMYGAIALLESLNEKGIHCETNFMDIVHMEVSEQMRLLDEMVNVQTIENVIKELKKEKKNANKPVKEKKGRGKKNVEPAAEAPVNKRPVYEENEEDARIQAEPETVTLTVTVNRIDLPKEEYERVKAAARNNEELKSDFEYKEVARITSEPIPLRVPTASVIPDKAVDIYEEEDAEMVCMPCEPTRGGPEWGGEVDEPVIDVKVVPNKEDEKEEDTKKKKPKVPRKKKDEVPKETKPKEPKEKKAKEPKEVKEPKEKKPKEPKEKKAKEPKEKKPKVARKKKESEEVKVVPEVALPVEKEEEEEKEFCLMIRDGQRYWTDDEHEKNGGIYSCTKDEDGDNAPGALIGHLVDGEMKML
jgi:hypothetical protein